MTESVAPVDEQNANKLPFSILTDLPSPAQWHKRSRQACAKMSGLDRLLTMIEQREIKAPDGTQVGLTEKDITLKQAELLFFIMTETKPILTIETGFGKGLCAALMTFAHAYNGLSGGHVPIEHDAKNVEGGIGAALLESFDLGGYQIMDHDTALVLPQIYMQQLNDGLGFVYFNHSTHFDEQMMEYFYVNQLLNEGGIIAVNTTDPARRAMLGYIAKNRHDYAIRDMGYDITLVQKPKLSELAQHNPEYRH